MAYSIIEIKLNAVIRARVGGNDGSGGLSIVCARLSLISHAEIDTKLLNNSVRGMMYFCSTMLARSAAFVHR